MRTLFVIPLLCLAACAAKGPTYGPADDEALEPVREDYGNCIRSQTAELIHGSNDVQFLTRHILKLCEPELEPAAKYLQQRGFDRYYIQQFLTEKRNSAGHVTSDFILRFKSGEAQGAF